MSEYLFTQVTGIAQQWAGRIVFTDVATIAVQQDTPSRSQKELRAEVMADIQWIEGLLNCDDEWHRNLLVKKKAYLAQIDAEIKARETKP